MAQTLRPVTFQGLTKVNLLINHLELPRSCPLLYLLVLYSHYKLYVFLLQIHLKRLPKYVCQRIPLLYLQADLVYCLYCQIATYNLHSAALLSL